VRLTRRRFLDSLRLGVGATLLSPLVSSLFPTDAWAQGAPRRLGVWLLTGNGWPNALFDPPGMAFPEPAGERTGWTMPQVLAPLAAERERLVLFEGLGVPSYEDNHTSGYTCLTGLPQGSFRPRGPSIDQFVAASASRGQPRRSTLFGLQETGAPTASKFFATAAFRPEPFFTRPSVHFENLFGPLTRTMETAIRERREHLLLDGLREDLGRVRTRLAGADREKLDTLEAVVADFEARQREFSAIRCAMTPAAPLDGGTAEDRLESMVDVAALAVACGLTSVAGIVVSAGFTHGGAWGSWGRLWRGTRFETERWDATQNAWVPGVQNPMGSFGHGPNDAYVIATRQVHTFAASLLARFGAALAQVPTAGGKTLWDQTVGFWANDNCEAHHSGRNRWSTVVMADTMGWLRGGGRYVRYRTRATPIGSVHCAIANALGAPCETFAGAAPNVDLR
jgi:hypothetical protein